MKTTETKPKAAHTPGAIFPPMEAHTGLMIRGWAVSPLHPSGDGSHYAALADGLTEQQAKLWASAPALLEALKACATAAEDCICPTGERPVDVRYYVERIAAIHSAAEQAKAAIAKATGQS